MLTYPQLPTGALSQFPIRKQHRVRTVVNTMADGSAIKLADPNGGITQWQLVYSDLSDAELGQLEQFFAAAEGTLNGFVFVDPAGNLLAWSSKLDEQVWTPGPLLTVGGESAIHLVGRTAGDYRTPVPEVKRLRKRWRLLVGISIV